MPGFVRFGSMRLACSIALLFVVTGCWTAPPRTAAPPDTLSESSDHALKRFAGFPHQTNADPENALDSLESQRDQITMTALYDAFGVNAPTINGRDRIRLTDVSCNRAQHFCEARDAITGERAVTVGPHADALIGELEDLDREPTTTPRCNALGCKVGAIACFTDRHDEDGFGGVDQDKGRIWTCDDSRRR